MKYLVFIFILFISIGAIAQSNPSGIPTQFSTGWFRHGWDQSDSGKIFTNRQPNFTPRFPGTVEFYQDAGVDSLLSLWTGARWLKLIPGFDSTSLNNKINLKLNISDTTGKWLAQSSRLVDTVYRVNDSTVGYTIKGNPYTFQILGRSSGGGGGGSGTVTSVGLSLPSAFNVTPSTITTSGTFSVTGAGTTLQYIRGNGTLATTDSGMIPNFYLKVRSLLSGTSPIVYNSTTGAISIPNANNTGTKGAATFNNSDFTDNGAGLISLRNPPGGPAVDTIFRTPGVDSIYYTINGIQRAIKDSIGTGGGGGTVTSVSGTTNRISVTNPTTTPVVDIAATYVGQTSITTLGTITTGTWNGSIIDIAHGGTGTSSPSLVAGTNISITGSWPNQTINATGSSATFPDGLLAATSNTPRVANDSDVVNTLNQYPLLHNPFRCGPTDSIYFFGDSYTAGSGASQTQFRWTSLFAFRMGGVEVNYGVAGSTLEKRVPIDYQSAPNMIDLLPLVPVKTFNRKLLVIAYGLNDMGQTAPAYNTTNYKTDYDSVIHYCVNQGWRPNEILLVPPYWIGYAGYQVYAGITGNAAPTVQRHTDFVFATQETATKWGTLYFDIFNDQLRNDTTLISSSDHIHPTDAGYEYIEWDVSKDITPSMKSLIGTAAPTSMSNPMAINTGAAFSNSTGDPSKIKICIYCDGTATNNFGIGVSSQNFEFHAGGAGTGYSWFINGNSTPKLKLGNSGTSAFGLLVDQNVSSIGSSLPAFLSIGGTFNTIADDTVNMKFRVYDVTSNGQAGINLSSQDAGVTGHLEYIGGYNVTHEWYIGPTLTGKMSLTNFLIPTLKIRAAADSVGTATGGYVFRDAATGDWKITQSSAGGNGIYGGSGSLPSDVTVTGASHSLTFDGLFNFRVNANTFLLAKSTPGAVYTTAVIGTDNVYEVGYTPTPTVYSKGSGILIDTNNNVSLGTAQISSSAPLYATGSAFADGFQNQAGNFLLVTSITSNATVDLAKNFYTIDATSGNVTITLIAASAAFGANMGMDLIFKRIDNSGNTVTIQRATSPGTDTIDGAASFTLTTQYESKRIRATSTSTWSLY